MKVAIKMFDGGESSEARLRLRRYVHAELSRFGSELTSIELHVRAGPPRASCRVVVQGRRFRDIDVAAAAAGLDEVVAAAMAQVQAEVAAAIARARSGTRDTPRVARPALPRARPRRAARGAS